MNSLFDFYKAIADFANRHRMIDFFKVISSVEEIGTMNLTHRSLLLTVESTNISRELNYISVTMSVFVVDKCIAEDQDSLVISAQENIFVISELQDFILGLDNDVSFQEVILAQAPETDYTATAAICQFTALFNRTSYCDSTSTALNLEE